MLRAAAGVALLAAAASAAVSDYCRTLTNCSSCVAKTGCGWCSTNVVFEDNSTGPRCAGPKWEQPFECHGIYSSTSCTRGYVCDWATHTCKEAGPGQGIPKAQCDANCSAPAPPSPPSPAAKVYVCENATKTCKEVPPGTPGSSSQEVCNNTCSGSGPAPGPADVYVCNTTAVQCVKVAPGTPGSASQEVCAADCVASYKCDPAQYQCVKQFGVGPSLSDCQKVCKNESDPCEPHYSCPQCLSASPLCGWCRTGNVTYANGKVGTRCAGVGPGIATFTCSGVYSTFSCDAEYACDDSTGRCVYAAPGEGGVPLEQCRSQCKAPAPEPFVPPEVCSAMLDVIFLFDSSSSITPQGWLTEMRSAVEIASNFTFGPNKTAAGVVKYGSVVPCEMKKNCCTNSPSDCGIRVATPSHLTEQRTEFLSILGSMNKTGGRTPTSAGIDAVIAEFQKNGRNGSHKAAVTVTDGKPNLGGGVPGAIAAADRLKALGVRHIVVSIGDFDKSLVDQMASDPPSKYALYASAWSALPGMLQEIATGICRGPFKCNAQKQCQRCQDGEAGCLASWAACDEQCGH